MIFEQLDSQDKEICKAIAGGVSNEDIKAQFGVGDDKIAQLRPISDNVVASEDNGEKAEVIPETTQAPMDIEADTEGEAKLTPPDAEGEDKAVEEEIA